MLKNSQTQTAKQGLLYVQDLVLQRGDRPLCQGITFELGAAEALHIIGDNGAGKTTLLKVLAGVLPMHSLQTPHEKQAYKSSIGRPSDLTTTLIGHSAVVFSALSVLDNLKHLANLDAYHLHTASSESSSIIEKFDDNSLLQILNHVGLLDDAYTKTGKLSSGQRRRVGLARLWLLLARGNCRRQLWLLDEPLTALDVSFTAKLETLVVDFLTLGGRVIFTSHQPFLKNHTRLQALYLAHHSSAISGKSEEVGASPC